MRHLKTLYVQVLIAIVLGVVVGVVWPRLGVGLEPLSVGFVKLIKLVVAPVVFCTVSGGIAHMRDLRKFGRIGIKALVYFEVVSTFALMIGLAVGLVVRPGRGFSTHVAFDSALVSGFVHKSQGESVGGFLLGVIPDTFFSPFSTGDLLPVILIAVLVGFALINLGEPGQRYAQAIDSASRIFFEIIRMVVRLAPIGAFAAMAYMVGKFGPNSLLPLGALVGTFYLTAVLFVLLVLGSVARLAGFSIVRFVRYIGEELFIVLGTSSSESVLPQLMRKLERLGVPKPIVGVVVPTGYSFNLDGTNIYMTLATLFLAQATGTHLSMEQLAVLLFVSMLTSKGASGVAGAGFITLAATLSSVPTIPIASLALLIGVDKFMSECRALTNTVGNGVASIVVASWNGELDREQLSHELDPRSAA